MTEAKPLRAVLGEQLRSEREERQLRQEDIASLARQHGLNWRRATVAAVEAGERKIELKELILLSAMLGQPLSWWVEGHGLDADEEMEMIQLTPDASAPRIGLVSMLKGESPAETMNDLGREPGLRRRLHGLEVESQWDTRAARWSNALQQRFDDENNRARDLWPKVTDTDLVAIRLAARHDSELKAARSLKLTPFDVATIAVERWGHGLTEEREKRLGEMGDLDPRSAQARRGHVTRGLMAELREARASRVPD